MANPGISRRQFIAGVAVIATTPAKSIAATAYYGARIESNAAFLKIHFNSMYGKIPYATKLLYVDTDGLTFYK